MRWVKEVFLYCMLAIGSALLIPGISQAEIYLAGMGGFSFQNDFTNVTSTGFFSEIPLRDANLKSSWMAGGKMGFYMPDYNWFGFETEGFLTEPEFQPWIDQGVGAKLHVITWAFNALIRYPGKRFQPYLGVGGGLFFAEIDTDLPGPSVSDNWVPGLNLLGGVRGFLTDSIAIFAEYKYNSVKLDLQTNIFNLRYGFEGTYSTQIVAAGLSYHFK